MASIEKIKTRSGEKRWRVRFDLNINGERQQKCKTFKTAADAKAFSAKTESSILSGMYADAKGLTVGEYLDTWLATYTTNCRPNTYRGYFNNINLHLKPRLGNVRLDSITTAAIQKAYNDIIKTEYLPAKYRKVGGFEVLERPARTYSPKMLRNVHAVLRMALEQARREGLIARNPADDAKLPACEKPEYCIPEPEQLQTLLSELQGADCYLAILTCALLACRRGEALGLYWNDIDFNKNTISLSRALIVNNKTNTVEIGPLKTKNARRILPLPAVLKVKLLKLKGEREEAAKNAGGCVISSPFVFLTVQGTPFRPDSISQAFKRAAKKSGMPEMRLHDLRHYGITQMLLAGADCKTISGFVGHATAQFTLNQYAHVMEKAKISAGAMLESKVLLPS